MARSARRTDANSHCGRLGAGKRGPGERSRHCPAASGRVRAAACHHGHAGFARELHSDRAAALRPKRAAYRRHSRSSRVRRDDERLHHCCCAPTASSRTWTAPSRRVHAERTRESHSERLVGGRTGKPGERALVRVLVESSVWHLRQCARARAPMATAGAPTTGRTKRAQPRQRAGGEGAMSSCCGEVCRAGESTAQRIPPRVARRGTRYSARQNFIPDVRRGKGNDRRDRRRDHTMIYRRKVRTSAGER